MNGMTRSLVITMATILASISNAQAFDVRVTVTNNAPAGGTYLTPAWVGFHNGTYDVFNPGEAASAGLEAISEDGNPGVLSGEFAGSGVDGVVGGAPLTPGNSAFIDLSIADDGSNSFFSYASMILASSDFFIGNANPLTTSVAGLIDGDVGSISFTVIRGYDSGTEVNDFGTSAGNPIYGIGGGQGGPNQGADQNGLVAIVSDAGDAYAAFLSQNLLNGFDTSALDFTAYESIATFTLTATPVPVPAAFPLLLSALGGLSLLRRRKA